MLFPWKINSRLRLDIKIHFLLILTVIIFNFLSTYTHVEAKENLENANKNNSNYESLKTFSEVLSLIESTYVEKVSSKKVNIYSLLIDFGKQGFIVNSDKWMNEILPDIYARLDNRSIKHQPSSYKAEFIK